MWNSRPIKQSASLSRPFDPQDFVFNLYAMFYWSHCSWHISIWPPFLICLPLKCYSSKPVRWDICWLLHSELRQHRAATSWWSCPFGTCHQWECQPLGRQHLQQMHFWKYSGAKVIPKDRQLKQNLLMAYWMLSEAQIPSLVVSAKKTEFALVLGSS